jgi:hypothetical protein
MVPFLPKRAPGFIFLDSFDGLSMVASPLIFLHSRLYVAYGNRSLFIEGRGAGRLLDTVGWNNE